MNPIVLFSVCLVLTSLTACSGRPADQEPIGKYKVSKTNKDDDIYRPVKRNEGRYIHMVQPYVHIHDNRELGKYRHIPNPYDGGYGPYAGSQNPYEHDESGNYDKYTVSNADFDIPAIRLQYGFPDHDPEGVKKTCDLSGPQTTSTTTRRPITTTTTTVRPRLFNYYEEGGWRILRQEEEKEKHKYDFLYHTENGIYGEEKAHLHPGAGTAAQGYYEYTGDDGELYRVNYKSDHNGFIPEGDHIPTPPPVPEAIKRALEYVAKKKETHGELHNGQYSHRGDPTRLQNMPTSDRPLQPRGPLPALPPLPTFAPQARGLQYPAHNQPAHRPHQRPADQLIQQTQLSDQLPQMQVQPPQQVQPEVQEVLTEKPQEEQMQQDQPQEEQPQSDQPQADQPMAYEPQAYEPMADQPQADQPQADQPQADQPQAYDPQAEQPQADQPQQDHPQSEEYVVQPDQLPQQQDLELQPDQSIASAVIIIPDEALKEQLAKNKEQSPEASQQETEFQPPYQSPDKLTDEANFELILA